MTNPEHLSVLGRRLLDRRTFLGTAGLSTAGLALASMLQADGLLAEDVKTVSGKAPIRPSIDPNNPYASRKPHFDVPAKQVLVIYCPGAVSHLDTFDYKPALTKLHGQKPPGHSDVSGSGGHSIGQHHHSGKGGRATRRRGTPREKQRLCKVDQESVDRRNSGFPAAGV